MRFNKNTTKILSPVIYQIFIIIMLFIKANPLLNSLKITTLLMAISVAWGGLLSLIFIVKNKKAIISNIYVYLLFAFIFSYCISVIFNFPVMFTQNVKDIIWFTLQILTLLLINIFKEKDANNKDFSVVSHVYLYITFIFAFVSNSFVLIRQGGVETYGKWGFISQRLFGLYRSPNYGAIYCVLSIIIAISLFKKSKVKKRIFLAINILANLMYIVYSGSNTGKITLIFGVVFLTLMYIITANNFKLLFINCIYGVLFIALMTASFPIIRNTTVYVVDYCTMIFEKPVVPDFIIDSPPPTEVELSFERTDYVEGSELGNGRLLHWQRALKVFPHYPVFGTTLRGYNNAVNVTFPDVNKSEKAFSLENDAITLLVCTGVVGLAIFLAFVIYVVTKVFSILITLFKEKDCESLQKISCPLAICLAVAASAAFTDAIIFTNVVQSAMFWICLGYVLSFDKRKGCIVFEKFNRKKLISE